MTDTSPVLIILDPDGYLVRAGQPPTDLKGKREVGQYAMQGYQIKTITIAEYRAADFKWIYEKDV
jgi:hypothetical protein